MLKAPEKAERGLVCLATWGEAIRNQRKFQSKHPLSQLEGVSSTPIACYSGEKTDLHLVTASFHIVVESDVFPDVTFLEAKHPLFFLPETHWQPQLRLWSPTV